MLGANGSGQVGDGTAMVRHLPTQVKDGESGVAGISAGSDFSCLVTTNGGVRCFGYGAYGHRSNRLTPVDVLG